MPMTTPTTTSETVPCACPHDDHWGAERAGHLYGAPRPTAPGRAVCLRCAEQHPLVVGA